MCEICSKLTKKTPNRYQRCFSGVFIVNFEHISNIVLAFLLLTLIKQMPPIPESVLLTNSVAVFAWWELETRCIDRFDFVMPKLYHISLTDSNDNTSFTKHVEMWYNIGNLDSFKFQGRRVVINLQLYEMNLTHYRPTFSNI